MKKVIQTLMLGVFVLPATAHAKIPKFKCLPVKIIKAQIGDTGEYKVKAGLETRAHRGFINRRTIRPKNRCFFPDIAPGRTMVFTVPEAAFTKNVRYTSNLRMQCIFLESSEALKEYGDLPSISKASGKDMLLKCGSAQKVPCDSGSNSKRNSKYRKMLKQKKQVALRVFVRTNDNMDSSAAREGKWNGRKVFCQAFHKDSGKVLFAMTYTIGPKS